MPIHFQNKVLQLSPSYIQKFDPMILNTNEENIKIALSKKGKVHTLVPLQKKFNAQQYRLTLRHMANKIIMDTIGKILLKSYK